MLTVTTIIILVVVVGLGVCWLIKSIPIIGPDEMGIKIIFGRPISVCDSGFVFVPYLPGFKCYLARYPKKMYNLDYPAREVITSVGELNGVRYGSVKLKITATVYLNFPRDPEPGLDDQTHPLIKILRANVPIDEDKLKNWSQEAVDNALRVAMGQITWGQAVADIKMIGKRVEDIFKEADGALIKAGFRPIGIRLVIPEIKLPKEIDDTLPKVDKARLEADAAKDVAERESIESAGTLMRMLSENTGLPTDEIQKAIQKSPARFIRKYGHLIDNNQDLLERLLALRKNALIDVRVNGAEGAELTLLNLLSVGLKIWQGILEKRVEQKGEKPKEDKEIESKLSGLGFGKEELKEGEEEEE